MANDIGREAARAQTRFGRYVAFISYSHVDEEIGDWLHRRLESYRTPSSLRGAEGAHGKIGSRLGKVFRDRVELSAARDLGAEIRRALEFSDALIVLCSPRSCASRYVAEEIRYFKQLGRGDRILAAIVDGEPHAAGKLGRGAGDECFPSALLYRIGADGAISATPEEKEPIAADFRDGKDGRENGSLKLIAGLLGLGLDELVQREKQAERRRRWRANAIAGAMAMLALVAAVSGGVAFVQRNLAQSNEARALRGEAEARQAQRLAEQNALEREEQRQIANYNAEQADIQALAARRGEEGARNALGRVFAERGWDAVRRGQLALGARYALAGWRATPANEADFRAVLGRALHDYPEAVALRGHEASITSIVFSPDRRVLVSASSDRSARVWNVTDGAPLAMLPHDDPVRGAAFSPDGSLAVTLSGNLARVWETQRWTEVALLRGHTNAVRGAGFSHDGRLIVTRSDDNTAMLWHAESGARIAVMRGHTRDVTVSRFTADDGRLLTAGGGWTAIWNIQDGTRLTPDPQTNAGRVALDAYLTGQLAHVLVSDGLANTARVVDVQTQRDVAILRGNGPIMFGEFLADGQSIVTTGLDNSIRLWDAASGEPILELEGHTAFVTDMSYNSQRNRLVTGSMDTSTRVWDLNEGRQLGVYPGSEKLVVAVAISSDGSRIAASSEDMLVRIWPVGGDRLVREAASDGRVNFLRFSPDGTRVALAGDNGVVRVLSFPGLAEIARLPVGASVASTVWSRNGSELCTAGANGVAQLWNVASRQEMRRFEHGGSLSFCDLSGDGARVATAGVDGVVRIWNIRGALVSQMNPRNGPVLSATFTPDGQSLVTASRASVHIWDVDTGRVQRELRHATGGFGVDISRDFGRIAGAGLEDSIVWNARTGEQIGLLRGQRAATRVVFSPDAARIASSALDGSVRIWDSESGTLIAQWRAHEGNVLAVGFSPDGNVLATAAADGVRIWNVSRLMQNIDQLGDIACADLLRGAGQMFSASEIAADPLIRTIWLAGESERSVCEPASGR